MEKEKPAGNFPIGADFAPDYPQKMANRCSSCPLTRRAFDKIKLLLLLIPVDKWTNSGTGRDLKTKSPLI